MEEDQTQSTSPSASEQAAAERDAAQTALAEARATQAALATALLTQVRAANPGIPAHLIDGSSAAAIDASLASARETVQQVLAANRPSSNGHTPRGGQSSAAAPIDLATINPTALISRGIASQQQKRG